jgi:hypothetical protein
LSSSNLLKGFGIGADVIGQLATDKALRRKSTGTVRGFDITDGELLENISVPDSGGGEAFAHSLNRVPEGAYQLVSQPGLIGCLSVSATHVVLRAYHGASTATVWVV